MLRKNITYTLVVYKRAGWSMIPNILQTLLP
jgi:hypothetical protein